MRSEEDEFDKIIGHIEGSNIMIINESELYVYHGIEIQKESLQHFIN